MLYHNAPEKVMLLGSGDVFEEIGKTVHRLSPYRFILVDDMSRRDIDTIVLDMRDLRMKERARHFYQMMISGVRFVDVRDFYEKLFRRIPLRLIEEAWFLEHVPRRREFFYDFAKRAMDIVVAIFFGILSLIAYPFVAIAIKLDDGGPIFFTQERIGENGIPIYIIKFRSMKDGLVTRLGKFLRPSRIDELPQLWNVVRGDLSLVGPRPEIPALADIYRREIPYYDIRHIVKPGLSGWAQIYHERHPHHQPSVGDTRDKLSYDLYYVKNRSFLLDVRIALKTIGILISQKGI